MLRWKQSENASTGNVRRAPRGLSPVDGVAGLAAGVVADLDVTLVELHSDVIVVSVVQQDAVVFSRGHLQRDAASLYGSRGIVRASSTNPDP